MHGKKQNGQKTKWSCGTFCERLLLTVTVSHQTEKSSIHSHTSGISPAPNSDGSQGPGRKPHVAELPQKPTNTDNVFRLKIWNHTPGLSPEKSKEPLFSLSLYSVSTAFKFHGSMSESFCIISCSFITGNLK